MGLKRTQEDKNLFIKNVTSEAKEIGLSIDEINDILSNNKVTFLNIIVLVIKKSPNISMSKKVIEKGTSINYAEVLLGEWVKDVTPSINTLKKALEFYIQFYERSIVES